MSTPLNDDCYDGNDAQIAALKAEVERLQEWEALKDMAVPQGPTPREVTPEDVRKMTRNLLEVAWEANAAKGRLAGLNKKMLEALEAVVNYEATPDFSKWEGVMKNARAAIAKAEGAALDFCLCEHPQIRPTVNGPLLCDICQSPLEPVFGKLAGLS